MWNIIDMILIGLAIACVISQIAQNVTADVVINKVIQNPNKFYNLSLLVSWENLNWSLVGFLIFFFNIRILRLLKFSKRLSLFVDVLHRLSRDAFNFGFFFMIIFMSFTQAFYLILNTRVFAYNTVIRSAENLFKMLLGIIFL